MPTILDLKRMNDLQRDNDIKDLALRLSEAKLRAKSEMIKVAERLLIERDEEIKRLRAQIYSLQPAR